MNNQAMAEQLREWAELVAGSTMAKPDRLPLVAGMREVADDLERQPARFAAVVEGGILTGARSNVPEATLTVVDTDNEPEALDLEQDDRGCPYVVTFADARPAE